MKILFVISSLSAGGAERVLSLLANELSEDHEVSIATLSDEPSFYPIDPRVTLRPLGLLRPSRSVGERLRQSLRRIGVLRDLIRSEDPDIVVSFMTQTNLLSIVAARLSGKPVIVSERIAYDFQRALPVRTLRRMIYPLADMLVVQSRGDAGHYGWMHSVEVIPNPVAYTPERIDFSAKEPLILGVGRLDPQKGFDRLIEAFARLDHRRWRLVIAGEGPERANLERLIAAQRLDNVTLIGRQKEIESWYRRASIFVLSSRREGFPNVLLEAMAHGCACVAFDCPYGPGEIIEADRDGILVPDQDLTALTESLGRLMEDASLRARLGKRAEAVRERYGIQTVVSRWEAIMKKVVHG